nr:hypothetical protein Itr_chr08CG11610 [Ipomoea trifida]GME10758.1 hypothetical protein Iba_scaffold10679CG0020 [Ipomoea batatas]
MDMTHEGRGIGFGHKLCAYYLQSIPDYDGKKTEATVDASRRTTKAAGKPCVQRKNHSYIINSNCPSSSPRCSMASKSLKILPFAVEIPFFFFISLTVSVAFRATCTATLSVAMHILVAFPLTDAAYGNSVFRQG